MGGAPQQENGKEPADDLLRRAPQLRGEHERSLRARARRQRRAPRMHMLTFFHFRPPWSESHFRPLWSESQWDARGPCGRCTVPSTKCASHASPRTHCSPACDCGGARPRAPSASLQRGALATAGERTARRAGFPGRLGAGAAGAAWRWGELRGRGSLFRQYLEDKQAEGADWLEHVQALPGDRGEECVRGGGSEGGTQHALYLEPSILEIRLSCLEFMIRRPMK